jgi:hypothetical protein
LSAEARAIIDAQPRTSGRVSGDAIGNLSTYAALVAKTLDLPDWRFPQDLRLGGSKSWAPSRK